MLKKADLFVIYGLWAVDAQKAFLFTASLRSCVYKINIRNTDYESTHKLISMQSYQELHLSLDWHNMR